MTPGYELFDHTADIGINARAATPADVLRFALEGLFAVIGDLKSGGEPCDEYLELAAEDRATLLRDFLAALLLMFETKHRRATFIDVLQFDDRRLRVAIRTELVDDGASVYNREVKAVTYHALSFREVPGGFEATVIVDI